jgi:hypothetical protein
MKRRILIFSILAVFGVLAFGANAAFAKIDFDPQAGEMIYTTEGIKYDQGDDVLVRHAESVGFTSWIKIIPGDYVHGQPWPTPNMAKYCFNEDWVLWACPATKVKVITGKGDDVITVQSNVTQPTTLIGGGGSDTITGGGGNDTIYGACGDLATCYGYSDNLSGGNGNDTLHGGDTTPVFGLAADILHGGNGDDTLDGGLGPDQLYGELGNDTGDYSAAPSRSSHRSTTWATTAPSPASASTTTSTTTSRTSSADRTTTRWSATASPTSCMAEPATTRSAASSARTSSAAGWGRHRHLRRAHESRTAGINYVANSGRPARATRSRRTWRTSSAAPATTR